MPKYQPIAKRCIASKIESSTTFWFYKMQKCRCLRWNRAACL